MTQPNIPELIARLRAEAGMSHGDGAEESLDWEAAQALQSLQREVEARDTALATAEAEARRFAEFYDQGSDGRNTFVILADKIAALTPHQDSSKEVG